jgi:chromosome segregation ATPase
MSGFESLKGIMQKTFSHSNAMTIARVKGPTASSVYDELEELENTVVDSIGRLKAALTEGEAVVASEGQQAEQVIENLRTNISLLEAKVKESEDTVQRKDSASQRMEQTLTEKIQALQDEVNKKDESLDSCRNEIDDLKSQIDAAAKQVTEFEQAIQQAKGEIARQAKRAEQITASSNAKITTLEAQLRENQEILRRKDSTIKGLEPNVAKIQNLESQLRAKEKDLADRNREVNDLKAEVKRLTKGITGIYSFFKHAEALGNMQAEDILADAEAPNTTTAETSRPVEAAEEKAAAPKRTGPGVRSTTTDAAPEPVPPSFFERMIRELSEVCGPIAAVIVRDHVKAVGESIEKFPRARVAELLENISNEISDEQAKASFRERLAQLYIVGKTVSESSPIE